MRTWLTMLVVLLSLLSGKAQSPQLTLHEWGTFTSLQDERGATLGGINTDDEPVPRFVHRIADLLLLRPTEVPGIFFQGAPHCHPDVTLRLETPVIYFHLPDGGVTKDLSVTARFRGGWLSEFFPDADVTAPGVDHASRHFGRIAADTIGSLSWTNLQIGGDWTGPATDEHVWTAPRAVDAAAVRTGSGESEKFLFYRGVGNIDAPIRVTRDPAKDELTLHDQSPPR